jgi:four helix bundle protein
MGNFRQLSVWQRSHLLAVKVHQLTTAFPLIERYGLAAQMRRAAVSVISNIAEGCGRQSDRELAYFLRIARGSVRELECQLLLARDLSHIGEETGTNLNESCDEISRMLTGLIGTVRSKSSIQTS